MRWPRWKALLAIFSVFFTGALLGALIFPRLAPLLYLRALPSEPMVMRRLNQHLVRELKLTAPQRENIRKILTDMREEIRRLQLENRPKIREIWNRSEERIRLQLDEEQIKRFEERVKRRRIQMERGPRPAP